jgi:hypothetical protein
LLILVPAALFLVALQALYLVSNAAITVAAATATGLSPFLMRTDANCSPRRRRSAAHHVLRSVLLPAPVYAFATRLSLCLVISAKEQLRT